MLQEKTIKVSVDTYTRVCLSIIAVLMTVIIVGLWAETPSPVSEAPAGELFLDSSSQRAELVKVSQETNAKLEKLIELLKSGDVKVQVLQSQEDEKSVPGGEKNVIPSPINSK